MSEPIKNVKLTDGEGNEPYTLVKLADENTKEPYILVKGIGGGDPTLTLDHIEVTKEPDKTNYFEGDIFDPTGMEVTAYFNATIGGEAVTVMKPVTDYEYDHTPLTLQTTVVTITYTYEHVTSASGVAVTVGPQVKTHKITMFKDPNVSLTFTILSDKTNEFGWSDITTYIRENGYTSVTNPYPLDENGVLQGSTVNGIYVLSAYPNDLAGVTLEGSSTSRINYSWFSAVGGVITDVIT